MSDAETLKDAERVPVPMEQATIALFAFLERETGEPAAIIAARILQGFRDQFGEVAGARLN
jgi:hypothetical protein